MRALLVGLALLASFPTGPASAQDLAPLSAVVAARTLYPGEAITRDALVRVEVRNPNPVREPVARTFEQAVGRVTRRTLLPRRYIPLSALRAPDLVVRGTRVFLHVNVGNVAITARGRALEAGALGAIIPVRVGRGRVLEGRVRADGSVVVER